jgi:hypothetical protein
LIFTPPVEPTVTVRVPLEFVSVTVVVAPAVPLELNVGLGPEMAIVTSL